MKVFIGVPTSEFARFSIFYDYLALLNKPENTVSSGFHTNSGAWNRNLIIDEAIAAKCTHIFFVDDDMALAPDTLTRLLEHDKDIVSGLYLNRSYPHRPVIFDYDWNDSYKVHRVHYLKENEKGLIEVEACGFGCVLIKIDVFNQLEKPYVRLGELRSDRRNEDTGFCHRVRKLGIKIFCDLDIVAGHIGVSTFWPNRIDGKWYTAIDTNGNVIINQPQLEPNLETELV